MHPAPIKVTKLTDIPAGVYFHSTLESGEKIFRALDGTIYALQPKEATLALNHHQLCALRDTWALLGGDTDTDQKIVSPPDTKRWQWLVRKKGTEPWFIALSSDSLLDCLEVQEQFTKVDHPF